MKNPTKKGIAERWGAYPYVKKINEIKKVMLSFFITDSPEYHLRQLEITAISLQKHVSILQIKINKIKGFLQKKKVLQTYVCEDCGKQRASNIT